MTVDPMDVTACDDRRFHYECDLGHAIINATRPLEVCPAWVSGEPCAGTLTRFGPGSRRRD